MTEFRGELAPLGRELAEGQANQGTEAEAAIEVPTEAPPEAPPEATAPGWMQRLASLGAASSGRVRLRTLVQIRWIAVVGQLTALAAVEIGFHFTVAALPIGLVIIAAAVFNLVASFTSPAQAWLSDRAAAVHLAFDLAQLSLLLFLTGGLSNPFAILLLSPVVVSASTLSRTSTLVLAAFAVVCASILLVWHQPLPWTSGGLVLPQIYLAGIWVAIVLALLFVAAYVSSTASQARRMADALAASQMSLAREQRLYAVGGLAAAAAHQLGSPLATIAVIAREMEKELPEGLPSDSPLREDVELLLQESRRCSDILADLAAGLEHDGGQPYNRLPFSALIEAAAAPFANEEVALDIRPARGLSPAKQPLAVRTPELLHGLGTLLQNAMQFAESRVEVQLSWSDTRVAARIRDDGPGFDDQVLAELGEPYVSTGRTDRRGREDHMGLGIFIARTLLGRLGADIAFGNRSDEAGRKLGAEVVVSWPRSRFELGGSSDYGERAYKE